MTKKIIVIILLIAMMLLLCGCNYLDEPLEKTSNTKAYIKINEEIIVIDVDAYTNGSNGTIIVRGIDGKTYKTHFMNVVLVTDTNRR